MNFKTVIKKIKIRLNNLKVAMNVNIYFQKQKTETTHKQLLSWNVSDNEKINFE